MKNSAAAVLFGWCLLTQTTEYSFKKQAVDLRDLTRGATIQALEEKPIREKLLKLDRKFYRDIDELWGSPRSGSLYIYSGVVSDGVNTSAALESSVDRKISYAHDDKQCQEMSLRDFELLPD